MARQRVGEVIAAQHRRVIDLIDEVTAHPSSRGVIDELSLVLAAHFRVEETLLSPYVLADPSFTGNEEHTLVRFALERLRGADGLRQVRSRARTLSRLVVPHIEAEERALLPRLEKSLGARASVTMGAAATRAFERFLDDAAPGDDGVDR